MAEVHETGTRRAGTDRKGLFATLGALGAFMASACCIVPLVLVTLGISGAWIGNLTALEPYKPFTSAMALVFIGLGFWQVYFRTEPVCIDGTCVRPHSRLVKTALWGATGLVLLSLTINWWAPLLY